MTRRAAARRSPRYLISLPIAYQALAEGGQTPRTGSGQTRDVSETGACLELPESLAIGTFLGLILHIEPDSLTVQAMVVWVGRASLAGGGALHGVSFPQISQDHRQLLRAFLRRQGALRLRVAMMQPVTARVRAPLHVRLLDLSMGGARIEHLVLLRPGSSCLLEFPPALGSLAVTARVVRSFVVGVEQGPKGERRLRYESGISFLNVTPDQQTPLAQLLERLAPEEGGEGFLSVP